MHEDKLRDLLKETFQKFTDAFNIRLKKSDESQSSRDDLNIIEGELHGRENPLAWENLPNQIRDRLDPFTITSMQGEMLNSSGNNVPGTTTVEFSGPLGPISASKPDKKRTRHITQPKGTLKHMVKNTDTLNSIAAMYDTTPSELKKLNKLMSTMIFPDQVIYVPDKDYIPSEPSSPIHPSPTEKEPPKSHSAPETPRDKRFGPVEVPMVRQVERPRTRSESGGNRHAPGSAQRIMPRPLSEAEAERLDQECLARFIKVNVKHITDGQGVVSGVLLVTPNAIMFDPNVSDPLVKELGADQYGVIAPMETVISAAMYHDIAAMKLKGVPKDESGVKPQVYHAPSCPMYEDISEEPAEEENGEKEEHIQGKDASESEGAPLKPEGGALHRKESARKRRKEEMTRTCSCELIPKPAQHFEDPPLYLCLKIGKPLNKKVPQHGPIESYMKNRPKSEYWFSIPRDKVDSLYAFFVQWSPNIYGGDDIDPLARGFIMVDEDEAEEQPKKTMDIIDDYYKPEMKKLTRQMTKDWEIVNVEEMKRRQLIYDEDKLPLPELSHPSTIMQEEHIRTLSKNLPPRSEGYPWTLVYSSDLHGFSLKTLYRSMQNIDSQILLILRDTRHTVFGALLSCAVKQKDHFYGTGECYLFTFHPEFRIREFEKKIVKILCN